MGIMYTLLEELNKNPEILKNGGVKRLNSEPYGIVQTKNGTVHNPIKGTTTAKARDRT